MRADDAHGINKLKFVKIFSQKTIVCSLTLLIGIGLGVYLFWRIGYPHFPSNQTIRTTTPEMSYSGTTLFTFSYPAIWGEVQSKKDDDGVEMVRFSSNLDIFILMGTWETFEKNYGEELMGSLDFIKTISNQEDLQNVSPGTIFPLPFDMAPSEKYHFGYLASEKQDVRGILFGALESHDIPNIGGNVRFIGYRAADNTLIAINYSVESGKKREIEKKYEDAENFEKYRTDIGSWIIHPEQDPELRDIEKIVEFMVCSLQSEKDNCSLLDVDMLNFIPTIPQEKAKEIAIESMDDAKENYMIGEAYFGPYRSEGETQGSDIPAWVVFLAANDHVYEIFIHAQTGEILEKVKHEKPDSSEAR